MTDIIKKTGGRKVMTRADDVQLLTWLEMSDSGLNAAQIGQAYGVTSERVRTAMNRVRATQ